MTAASTERSLSIHLYTFLTRCQLPHREGSDTSRCTHLLRWHPRAWLGGSPRGSQGLPCLRTVGCVARAFDRCLRAWRRRNGWWLSTSVGGHDLQRPHNPRPLIPRYPQRSERSVNLLCGLRDLPCDTTKGREIPSRALLSDLDMDPGTGGHANIW